MAINSATTRAVLKEGIPAVLSVLKKRSYERNKPLEEYQIVKCVPGEKIVNVQRHHPITFVFTLIAQILTTALILIIIFASFLYAKDVNTSFSIFVVSSYAVLTVICFFSILVTLNFLTWFYRFYVITNKVIIYRQSFRIGGEYSETIYRDKMHVQDIDRVAINVIYDFLKIQDVYVYFQKQEREEPFIFKTPQSAQKIDDTIQKLIIEPSGEI